MAKNGGQPLLVADIGGTWSRVALAEPDSASAVGVVIRAERKFANASFGSLSAIFQEYLRTVVGPRPRAAAMACAGVVLDNTVINETLPWRLNLRQLAAVMGVDDLKVVNDFVALGYVTRAMASGPGEWLCNPAVHQSGPTAVIGPGTGLGTAVRIGEGAAISVLASEMGQTNLAPGTARERRVLEILAARYEHVSYESVLSGAGLLALYEAVASLQGREPTITTPAGVTQAAKLQQDGDAAEAVQIFCGLLGSYTGNVAMTFMAAGGVYVTGSVVESMRDQLGPNHFLDRFVNKGRMTLFLQRVPVKVVAQGDYGLLGVALWYQHQAHDSAVVRSSGGVKTT